VLVGMSVGSGALVDVSVGTGAVIAKLASSLVTPRCGRGTTLGPLVALCAMRGVFTSRQRPTAGKGTSATFLTQAQWGGKRCRIWPPL
jgi:hypothetical protein